jgi:hypothetical protein
MHSPRPSTTFSLLSLIAALGLVLTPALQHADAAKPASAAALKKSAGKKTGASRARSEAAKKGWETRNMKAAASANWAARTNSNPALKKDKKAEATFKARSMASQKAAAKRKATATTAKPAKKVKTARKVKRMKVAAAGRSAAKAKNSKKNKNRIKNKKKAAFDDEAAGAVEAEEFEDGSDEIDTEDEDWSDVLDNLDPGVMVEVEDAFAKGLELEQQGFEADAADQYIEGHEMAADEAFAAAEDYEAEERFDEADAFREFGNRQLAEADKLREAYPPDEVDPAQDTQRAERATGFIQRFKANRAAKKAFKAMMDSDPGMRAEYNRLKREKGSFKNGFFAGLAGMTVVRNLLPIIAGTATVLNVAFLGLGAVTVGSIAVRQYRNRDRSRKELVNDLYSSNELQPHEIQTYQAAGWL